MRRCGGEPLPNVAIDTKDKIWYFPFGYVRTEKGGKKMTAAAIVREQPHRALLNLLNMFDRQAENLLKKNYHLSVGMDKELFQKTWFKPLLNSLVRYYEQPDNLLLDYGLRVPFLIVFPHTFIPRETQLSMITWVGLRKSPILKLKEPIADRMTRSDKPYIALDVDPGTQLQGLSVDESIQQINIQARGGLTLDEGIALATHYPEILLNHGIDLPGSLTNDGLTPYIQEKNNGIVVSKHFPDVPSKDRFGSASLSGMLVFKK